MLRGGGSLSLKKTRGVFVYLCVCVYRRKRVKRSVIPPLSFRPSLPPTSTRLFTAHQGLHTHELTGTFPTPTLGAQQGRGHWPHFEDGETEAKHLAQ